MKAAITRVKRKQWIYEKDYIHFRKNIFFDKIYTYKINEVSKIRMNFAWVSFRFWLKISSRA